MIYILKNSEKVCAAYQVIPNAGYALIIATSRMSRFSQFIAECKAYAESQRQEISVRGKVWDGNFPSRISKEKVGLL